ncbi:hypothetical protein VN97_g2620 [Penicillium thymicola]|uniref:Major facilitator superfamily (MFS) profile domain-containing protein n=1 Tax=Penicillium thymicola TaxID=293382 RepID=A0AAI9TNN0_PENTH|nr:hypothetical protein VN97_g2620 [Penicillium thymicola]
MTRFFGLRGSRLNHVALLGVVMPAIVSMGYNQGLLGGVLTLPYFEAQFPEIDVSNAQPSEKHYKSTLRGTVVALYSVGGFLGAIACIAVGLGTGAQLATAPIWQSEISPAAKRGAHVATIGIFAGTGLTLGLLVDLGMSYVPNSASWRVPVGLPIILCIIVIVFTCQMPESPRWLVRQGQVSAAREVFAALRDAEIHSEMVNKEILDVESSLAIAGKGTLRQIFQMGHQRIFHRASLATGGLILLQLTGVNSITFYSTTIFQTNLQLDSTTSRILAVIYQFCGVIGGIICVYTIEGFGRRFVWLSSAATNTIAMTLVAALSSQSTNTVAMHAAAVFIFFFHISMIAGFGGIPFLYASEVAPLSLRTTINGIGSSLYWALSVLIAEVTPIAFNAIGWKYFLIFACLNFLMIPVIYLFYPETSGMSLEDIDEVFIMSTGWLDTVHVAKQLPQKLDGRQPEGDCPLENKDNGAPKI